MPLIGGYGRFCGGGDPQDGDFGANVLSLEEEVRRRYVRVETAETIGEGEPEAEAVGGGFEFGQEDAAGCSLKKTLKPDRKRDWADIYRARYQVSIHRTCEVIELARSTPFCRSMADDQVFLRMRIKELAQSRVAWGYRRIHILLQREGWTINHKRVYRIYTQEGLTLRKKRPKSHVSSVKRVVRSPAKDPVHSWLMDFMADTLFDGLKRRH